ncbi:hypothetical protein ACVJF0_008394 [Bradyrhizobium elkanii]
MSRTPHPRIEAGERILEHHLQTTANGMQPAGREIVDALAIEHDLAGGDVEQPQDGAADRRLAAAGFADQREGLAASDLKGHAIHGVDRAGAAAEQAAANRKMLLEVVDLEQRSTHAAAASLAE